MQLALAETLFVPKAAPKKQQREEGFGPRLARLRQARGFTQEELGATIGLSNRMVAYYERDAAQPPGALLEPLAQVLGVSIEELVGAKALGETTPPKTARLLKRLRRIEELPPADQRAVLKLVDALVVSRQRAPRRQVTRDNKPL